MDTVCLSAIQLMMTQSLWEYVQV